VLLFVFWYCYKRGKETRLEKERDLTQQEVDRLDQEYKVTHPTERYTTTAEPNASMEEVKAGIDKVDLAKQTGGVQETAASTEHQPK
jgi:hypothetical protein